jgi:hypothetical protein
MLKFKSLPMRGWRRSELRRTTKLLGLLGAVSMCALAARPADAGLWTTSGSGSDGALDAEANITFSTGEMQVTITNLLDPATIISIGQSVSDLSITLGSSPGTNVEADNTAVGQQVNVASDGSVTDVAGTPGRWVSSSTGGFAISGDTITLEAIGHGSPTQLILPSDGGGGYPDSNASIVGHSPNTDGPATFTVDLTGVTSSTTISSVQFSFGTGPDTFLPGTMATPAPPIGRGLPVLMAVGGLLFGARLWERGKKRFLAGAAGPQPAA